MTNPHNNSLSNKDVVYNIYKKRKKETVTENNYMNARFCKTKMPSPKNGMNRQ